MEVREAHFGPKEGKAFELELTLELAAVGYHPPNKWHADARTSFNSILERMLALEGRQEGVTSWLLPSLRL